MKKMGLIMETIPELTDYTAQMYSLCRAVRGTSITPLSLGRTTPRNREKFCQDYQELFGIGLNNPDTFFINENYSNYMSSDTKKKIGYSEHILALLYCEEPYGPRSEVYIHSLRSFIGILRQYRSDKLPQYERLFGIVNDLIQTPSAHPM